MNLPNSLTVGRIIAAPLVATLPLINSWPLRLLGFVLFILVAVTDYWDGKLARSRNLVTTLGSLLDPLADKLLLLATFVPMYILQAPPNDWLIRILRVPTHRVPGALDFPFLSPLGPVGLPFWVLVIVLGRELFMTIIRQSAARRGVVISAIGPAKWKTGFQWTWVGTAFFWFAAATLASRRGWTGTAWRAFALFNGMLGIVTMTVAVALTLYSLWLYLRRYGFRPGREGRR